MEEPTLDWEPVAAQMEEERMISRNDYKAISEKSLKTEKIAELINIIQWSTPDAYQAFLRALYSSNEQDLLKLLGNNKVIKLLHLSQEQKTCSPLLNKINHMIISVQNLSKSLCQSDVTALGCGRKMNLERRTTH